VTEVCPCHPSTIDVATATQSASVDPNRRSYRLAPVIKRSGCAKRGSLARLRVRIGWHLPGQVSVLVARNGQKGDRCGAKM